MIDLTPVANILGRLLVVLGLLMLLPAMLDWALATGNAGAFVQSSLITAGLGVLVALSTGARGTRGLDARTAFLLTLAIWIVLPGFGALPFMLGAPGLSVTDAYFEAVSGLTTTGATVVTELVERPAGMHLWRGMLNWLGGLGIAFVAMIFLPVMRVGGMQFFRTEGFDTLGKVLPRAQDIALSLLGVYAGLTVACLTTYLLIGMQPLDAVVHALASIATGGFSPQDASFGAYRGAGEYAGALFMLLAATPYILYVQMVNGQRRALWGDPQVRSFVIWVMGAVLVVTLWRLQTAGDPLEASFRETLFNMVSVMTGTGFGSGSFSGWGGFALLVTFVMGVIGGCSGSSSAGLSVFRVQVSLAALRSQIGKIASPSRVAPVRYAGRAVDSETLNSVAMFVTFYVLLLGIFSVALTLTGVDQTSALFGAWATLGNIGYSIGPMVARTGTFVDFPDTAKWLMTLAMLMGRLSLLAFFVIFLPRFWRN
ncbi:TrkH family potassium uptake protein [Gemmobacter denitrificans]|uniref:Trk system potassium uptake protein n=1 Tax=Gemmobacter denitrificans TaxID=3123040 RepID=A0ABU8BZF6_9RHOB